LVLEQVTMRELVTVATGSPRFELKLMPVATANSELHTAARREIKLLCLADGTDTFILHNRFVGGDVWSDELGDYTDPVWETVVLHSGREMFEAIPTGPDSTGRLEWSGGSISWNTVAVEWLREGPEPVLLAAKGAHIYTTCFDGNPCEFLVDLELFGPMGEWRLTRSLMGPSSFTLVTGEPSLEPSA
jgi:hypothetical protein